MMKIVSAIAASALLCIFPAQAQTLKQTLDYGTAAKIRDGCIAWATAHGHKIAVAVFNPDGTMVTFAQMDGVPAGIVTIAQWKGKSAATSQESTAETATWGGPAPGIATFAGGIPFFADTGSALGGVGASGAETDEDVDCAEAGIAAAGVKTKVK